MKNNEKILVTSYASVYARGYVRMNESCETAWFDVTRPRSEPRNNYPGYYLIIYLSVHFFFIFRLVLLVVVLLLLLHPRLLVILSHCATSILPDSINYLNRCRWLGPLQLSHSAPSSVEGCFYLYISCISFDFFWFHVVSSCLLVMKENKMIKKRSWSTENCNNWTALRNERLDQSRRQRRCWSLQISWLLGEGGGESIDESDEVLNLLLGRNSIWPSFRTLTAGRQERGRVKGTVNMLLVWRAVADLLPNGKSTGRLWLLNRRDQTTVQRNKKNKRTKERRNERKKPNKLARIGKAAAIACKKEWKTCMLNLMLFFAVVTIVVVAVVFIVVVVVVAAAGFRYDLPVGEERQPSWASHFVARG